MWRPKPALDPPTTSNSVSVSVAPILEHHPLSGAVICCQPFYVTTFLIFTFAFIFMPSISPATCTDPTPDDLTELRNTEDSNETHIWVYPWELTAPHGLGKNWRKGKEKAGTAPALYASCLVPCLAHSWHDSMGCIPLKPEPIPCLSCFVLEIWPQC